MKRLIIGLVFGVMGFAQTPGTVVQTTTTTTTVTATADTLVCRLTNQIPTMSIGVRVDCASGTTLSTQSATLAEGAAGWIGSLSVNGNTVTWEVKKTVGNPFAWAVVANGTSSSGTF